MLATLCIAMLVALASPGVPVWTELLDGETNREQALNGVAELVLLGLMVVTAGTLVVRSVGHSLKMGAPPLGDTLFRALTLTGIALAFLVLLVLARAGSAPERGGGAMQMDWFPGLGLATEQRASPGAFGERTPRGRAEAPPPQRGALPPLLLAVALAAVAIAAAALHAGRRNAPLRAERERVDPAASSEVEQVELRSRLLSTIEAMLADPDPRTSVVGAYARLLDSMAGTDGERLPFEAPREHLHRVLAHLRLPPGPLATLVDLFELARFSGHRMNETQRQKALEALRIARADLNGADPPVRALSAAQRWTR